jgi:flagellar motor component MotA
MEIIIVLAVLYTAVVGASWWYVVATLKKFKDALNESK